MNASNDIAVVGMAGRFPGARNLSEFWRNIRDGVESITFFSDQECLAVGVDPSALNDPNYVKARAVLADVEMFDAGFFGLSPKDAAIMDPQHRHFLECAWEALEHAGHTPESFKGAIGVYAGSGMNAYLMFNLMRNQRLMDSVGMFLMRHIGNDKDFLTTRVSYELNLNGPSVNIQTACSTSLVAIHVACQSLLTGECDLALAGGVTIAVPQRHGYFYREGEILSRDGHCRAFDAAATGTVFGSGVGITVLRRLEDAIEDGDTIHAIIKGSAINNDGSRKAGYLAPSVDAQAAAIAEAIRMAGGDAESISYVEAHGTGTAIGDPIEFSALSQAFRQSTSENHFCGIGSLKTNIGHLDTAAGVAGFIKTVLALRHRQIPPSLHFEQPNPLIDYSSSPFYVNARLQHWPSRSGPRRAGISSLGVGGTNAHLILEESRQAASRPSSRPWHLLVLSARSQAALNSATENLIDHLSKERDDIADIAFTLQTGRRAFGWRRFVVCSDASDACRALSRTSRSTSVRAAAEPSVAFLFPGGGSQHVRMGADLYDHEPVYREVVDRAANLVRSRWGIDFMPWLYPKDKSDHEANQRLEQPSIALPALFACEYALAKLWQSWGIEPESMIGHSKGEYVAACLADVVSFEDALALVVVRGRLFEKLASGAMLAVPLAEDELSPLLPGGLSIAAVNAPHLCVASGEAAAITALQKLLSDRGLESSRVRIPVAAHSAMVEPILDEFRDHIGSLRFRSPRIPYISNVTGTWITPDQVQDPQYWVTHLRSAVRFSDGIQTLLKDPDRILVEVGPGNGLGSLACLHDGSLGRRVFATLPHPKEAASARQTALNTLGQLWQAGKRVDWGNVHNPEPRRRVPLPTYPFERQRYWVEPDSQTAARSTLSETQAPSDDVTDWFYCPVWEKTDPAPAQREPDHCWLVFADPMGLGARLKERLVASGRSVVVVEVGERFAQLGEDQYSIAPARPEDHLRLVRELRTRARFPSRIAHLWTVGAGDALPQSMLDLGFYSLLFFTQALANESVNDSLRLAVVSDQMQKVDNESLLHPEKATLLGPCRVIPREFPNIRCQSIDIDSVDGATADRLITELSGAGSPDATVVYRNGQRWIQALTPRPLAPLQPGKHGLRPGGAYLITGGYGGLGLAVAEHLAKTVRARLVLVGRTKLPHRSEWPLVLQRQDVVSARIRKIQEIERLGAEVLTLTADVCDALQMRAAFDKAHARFGAIHGIIHAAGVLDDGLIALKSRLSTEGVLRPKVQGTLVVESLAADYRPDFLALFSSISSRLGLAGQVDYTAANAFLNANADRSSRSSDLRVIAINWPTWRDVGMVADAKSKAEGTAMRHPLLGRRRDEAQGRIVYSASYSPKALWVLDEHRVTGGSAVLPGTAYVEIAQLVVEQEAPGVAVEINELLLLAPLTVGDQDRREIRIKLDKAAPDRWKLSISSKTQGWDWLENARATVRPLNTLAPARIGIAKIAARCAEREILCGPDRRSKQERRLTLGRRWRCMRRILLGQREAMAELELAPEFSADLTNFAMHPALLDQATGFALPLVDGYDASDDFYVPMAYQRIRIWRPLSRRPNIHARYRGTDNGTVAFDFTVMDEHGEVAVEIDQFTMRRVDSRASFGAAEYPAKDLRSTDEQETSLLDELLANGIAAQQGLEALDRILAHRPSPAQIIVSPVPLEVLERRIESRTGVTDRRPGGGRARSFVAPRTPVEEYLSEAWSKALGLDQVSVEDNWFELGGHSLLGIRIVAQLRQEFRIDLSPDFFFESLTISAQARIIEQRLAEPSPIGPQLIPVGRQQFRRRRTDLLKR